jgi:hypothetical protein
MIATVASHVLPATSDLILCARRVGTDVCRLFAHLGELGDLGVEVVS